MREVDYTFNYNNIPGGAMFKYRNAFLTHDYDRLQEYYANVRAGNAKINSKTLYPYQIIRELERSSISGNILSKEKLDSLDMLWNSFDKSNIAGKTIVVRDGSGSMFDDQAVSASSVATSLAILFSERLTGEFHNKFITFSANPKLVEIKGNTISEKFDDLYYYSDPSNTDIYKVYNLILNVYQHKDFTKEDALDRIVIISDMEFDAIDPDESTFEKFKKEFANLGYNMPEIVFWNVRARNISLPCTLKDDNVKLVSGASSTLIDIVAYNNQMNQYDLMMKTLEKYSEIDLIKL